MNSLKMNNIPTMPVGKAVQLLSNAYVSIIRSGTPIKEFPSVMLWGAPGVGKSQGVREIGEAIKKETGKEVHVTDVRLLLFNPVDLRGIPTANENKTLAVWLKPEIFKMDPSEDIINILFLDEISAAPQSVQAAAYQITLDRKVGEHTLPNNCFVIAAGNRVTDKSVAYKMPKALANRLLHINIESEFDSWRKWAMRKGIDSRIVGFLSFSRDKLMMFDSANEDLAFATPRSWEMVSNVLNNTNKDSEKFDEVFELVAGLVGMGTALEFRSWLNVYKELPDIEDIFNGKQVEIINNPKTLFALSSAIYEYARKHKDELEIEKIDNSIDYIQRLPKEYSVLIMYDYNCLGDEFLTKLKKSGKYLKWLEKNGKLLNAFN